MADQGMTANPLNQLRDIHLPDPVGWWPLAPGWYILAALLLFGFFLMIRQAHLYYKNQLPKRQALKLLDNYQKEYALKKNNPLFSAKISELLRRVALVYYPRHQVAGLKGDDWINFLNQSAKDCDFNAVKELLTEAPYRSNEESSLTPLFKRAKQWIKQRRKPCLN